MNYNEDDRKFDSNEFQRTSPITRKPQIPITLKKVFENVFSTEFNKLFDDAIDKGEKADYAGKLARTKAVAHLLKLRSDENLKEKLGRDFGKHVVNHPEFAQHLDAYIDEVKVVQEKVKS